ncbi:MAG TPA: hypothetical protein VLH84_00550 [Patescibacteria group bacterium]|nr:hypothetical protein [Patescibacteria group bacterium]
MDALARSGSKLLASRVFFRIVLGFFVFEAAWVAVSSLYPMAFDEEFHLGIIKIYSHHLLPFLGSQPASANVFGPVQHDPSYLYHYLMSFPYRLIALFVHSQMVQIIFLRLIDVGLCTLGLVLFARFMRRAGLSAALSNVALTLFVLIPIVPLLAGQINYDNLLIPVVAGVGLLTLTVRDQLRARTINVKTLIVLVVLCLLGSLIKYAFLPIFAAVFLYLVWELHAAFRRSRRALGRALVAGYRACSGRLKIGLAAAFIVVFGLFAQRYVVNVFSYHAAIPDCAAVLSDDACESYGPWARDNMYAQTKGYVDPNPIGYTYNWLQGLHYRLFFMISGSTNHYTNYPPLVLPSAAFVVIGVFGSMAMLFYGRQAFRGQRAMLFLVGLVGLYLAALWVEDFREYLKTGAVVAVNGRYLLPVLLPAAVVVGRSMSVALKDLPRIKLAAATVAVVLFLQGGGLFSYILRSDPSWYWPNNQPVVDANNAARSAISPFILKSSKNY